MPPRDSRVSTYIARSAPFARPILRHIRAVVHAACPGVREDIKWGMPAFVQGRTLCMMAAFQAHAALVFPDGGRIAGVGGRRGGAMGQFGRLLTVKDLPARGVLAGHMKRAAALAAAKAAGGVPARVRRPRPAPRMPADLARALAARSGAKAHWDAFPPGERRQYVEWVTGARRPETRARRIAIAAQWIAAGKRHNWKYSSR